MREGWGGGGEEGKNMRRMKADTEQHQLRMTADGEPDRAQRERRETMLEEGEDRKNSHWRNGGVGKKTELSTIEAGRQGEMGDKGGGGGGGTEISMHLDR